MQVVPRIDSPGVLQVELGLQLERHRNVPDVVLMEVPGRKPLAASRIVTQQVETVVRLKSGTAVLVQADSLHSTDR